MFDLVALVFLEIYEAIFTIADRIVSSLSLRRETRRRRERRDRGLCEVCGYDIRACAGRCSECGAPLPPKARECYNPQRDGAQHEKPFPRHGPLP